MAMRQFTRAVYRSDTFDFVAELRSLRVRCSGQKV
jgi:hypothetical protein